MGTISISGAAKRYRILVSFIGTEYAGFQVQPGHRTIQGELCSAAARALGAPCTVTGCSRTDSGVHSTGFVALIEAPERSNHIPPERLGYAMNQLLPSDIAVIASDEPESDFHPRYSARGKLYEYIILTSVRDPFWVNRAYQRPRQLDIDIMNSAAADFIGEHDFSSFMAAGSSVSDTIRRIYELRVERDGRLVRISVHGNGFLYNMVRIIAGTLIDVSDGRLAPETIGEIIARRDRSAAGFTAPAEGLYLRKVFY